ncbi:hypothetical protein NLJ89_g775 [Agrocybe chaxingu]|uniref:N-acetyltransferase domain-containing protein n=1 Tax=Agrocybe chaxingu TaxID=84603 RepID=A0A9W8N1D8_9AGAR|nr:hypothetical protein NLJ89_g775 [Agrocybe chaxingu]
MAPTRITIQTSRLLLRGAKEGDAEAFHACFRDLETMNYWSTPPHTSIEQTITWVDSMMTGPYNGIFDFVVCVRPEESSDAEPVVIGKAGFWDGKEIGYILNRAHWGKGYASEAFEAILPRYWATEGSADIIKADVDPRNGPSLRLLKKLGFEVTGTAERTYETHLGWCDSVYLKLRRQKE